MVAGKQVIADTQIQGQAPRGLPVILKIGAYLKIPPVPHVFGECRGWVGVETGARRCANAWIHAGIFFRRGIGSKEHGVEELVGRASHTEQAVLDVPAEICPDLKIVISVADRDHVRVRVDMLLEELRITRIGTKPGSSIVELTLYSAGLGYAGNSRVDEVDVLLVANPSFVQDCR